MKNILISTYDMEVGGVERSLITLLDHIDYKKYNVDLMLYRHHGDFLGLINKNVNILSEVGEYATFRKSISQIIKEKMFGVAGSRLLARIITAISANVKQIEEPGYIQMQLMWKFALPFLPKIEKKYDVAISYLWPHDFVAEKVYAKKKIAWIHTDYSTINTHIKMDTKVWRKFDHIIAVSEACKYAFLHKYSEFYDNVSVIENIVSPEFIRNMSNELIENSFMSDKSFKIVTVARLSHAKGIDLAVKALNVIKEKGYENISWYVVGYGGEELKIRQLIKEFKLENRFILLGKQTNPYPYIKHADLYVQPSRYEGKAVTVGEAQILGKPVIITDYPTAESQVKNRIDGLITELSEYGIANCIINLYENLEERYYLMSNCQDIIYNNDEEIKKLYQTING
ncbi:glycosyltransferase [Metabacillus sp. cB07]|uniref:glycosyltransferase n=1 Tax=Metabacillus sp. cB07 TaxID=2806989 RepID=UPI0019394C24|nr:glycosyltransferase [Metabacillus sp. cB07]